jgi:hypothetical protein
MPARRNTSNNAKRSRKPRFNLKRFLPSARLRKRWYGRFKRAPLPVQVTISVAVILVAGLTVNWIYQVVRKPSELFFPVSGTLYKMPQETWREYAAIFRKHSTAVMTPELLAALAQVEGSGNPIVRTYWRWSLSSEPFHIYRPASSAVGMYQITDGTFAEARRYCIRNHVVAEEGPWDRPNSCWFNSLYMRVIPSDAVEMTSAYLDRAVSDTLSRHGIHRATLRQKQELATLTHLCGAGAGDAYARRGFRLLPGQRCGDHEARVYIARVNAMKALFARLAAEEG